MQITSTGYILLQKDGVTISQHREVKEAVERASQSPGYYTIKFPDWGVSVPFSSVGSQRSIYLTLQAKLQATMSGLRRVLTSGTGTQSGTYTPTHYVAPFASVSGAVNDYADLGATSWTNATSSGTPTTLGTAMARAVAGNNVRCAPGTYTGTTTASRWIPSFGSAGLGTSGNPIVFFAQYPAASNYGSTSLYSDLRKPGETNPVLGPLSGSSYVIFDGFYASEVNARSGPNAGIFQIASGSTGTQYRRCVIDRGGSAYSAGFNGNAIYLEATIDARIVDCMLIGAPAIGGNIHNDSSLEIYNSANYTVEYCTFDGALVGCYQKENDAGVPYVTSGIIRYNKFLSCTRGIEVQQGVTTSVYQNLVYALSSSGDHCMLLDGGPDRTGTLDFTIYNNTLIVNSTNTGFGIEPGVDIATSEFRDNIIYAASGHTGKILGAVGAATLWTWADWTLNYNCYYTVNGTLSFFDDDGSTVTGIANWRTATGGEAQTITSDPQFVNTATNDYRLASNGQAALTASSTGGPVGCYITGSEEIGVRSNPTY